MHLLEYRAKGILTKAHIQVPEGHLITEDYVFEGEVILKAQVPTGNRGRRGGILKVASCDNLNKSVERLKQLNIDGYNSELILAEEILKFDHEHYFSLIVDYDTGSIRLLAIAKGGVDVEETQDELLSLEVIPKHIDDVADKLRKFYGYDTSLKESFFTFLHNVFDCFVKSDALLLEINPLVIINKTPVAIDCKMEIDDNSLFRHPEIDSNGTDANFVMLNPNGNTAIVANGAGLAMATVDQVNQAGLIATNFLDIGGGAGGKSIAKQFSKLSKLPNINAIIVNIFAGITHCDQVASAIIATRNEINALPPLFIRLHGTNFNEARVVLDKAGIELFGSLNDCIEAAKNV